MQTPIYSTKDLKRNSGTRNEPAPRPGAFSFSCLVLDKFAAAAENLPSTPTERPRLHDSEQPAIQTAPTDDSSLNLHESVLSMASSMDSDANASARRLQLRKLRHQEITSGTHLQQQLHPWETTTKAIQQEALRALQSCQPRDDDLTLRTGGDETNTSMQAVFPDDLSDYELGTIMEDDDPHAAIKKSMTSATNESSQLSQVSPDDLKELVQAASTAVDTLERKLIRCRRISICLLVLLIVVAILAIALGVGLVGNDPSVAAENGSGGPSKSNATETDHETTPAPTMSPRSSLDTLREQYLPSYTLAALEDPQSPQAKAWSWLERQTQQQALNQTTSSTVPDSLLTRFVLATLYFATNGTIWNNNTSWLSAASECEWYNDAKQPCVNGTLMDLSLPSNNMTGVVPQELELLTGLTKVDLSFNRGVVLPENLSAMKGLQELDLEQIGLSSIPRLPSNLQRFNARTNALQRIPSQLAALTGLQTLLMGGNVFHSQGLPVFLRNLINLTYLSVENSRLTGSIPTELGSLSVLEYLILEENSLVGTIPPELSRLTSLKLMTLHRNQLSGSVPASVCSLKTEINMFVSVDCNAVQCDCGCGCGL